MNKELLRLELVADRFFKGLANIPRLLNKNLSMFAGYNDRDRIGEKVKNQLQLKLGISKDFLTTGEGEMLTTREYIVEERDLNSPAYRLKKHLKDIGKTSKELAEECGVTAQAVSFWLKGDELPTTAIKKLREAGYDVEFIVYGKEKAEVHKINQEVKNENAAPEELLPIEKMTILQLEKYYKRIMKDKDKVASILKGAGLLEGLAYIKELI